MTDKVIRGQLLTFLAEPIDYLGSTVTPDSIKLYLNYKHDDGTIETDDAVDMEHQTDGTWIAEFDTSNARPGVLFASLRAINPPGAQDLRLNIIANPANPNP